MTDEEVDVVRKGVRAEELPDGIDSRQWVQGVNVHFGICRARFGDASGHLTAGTGECSAELLVEDRYPVVSGPLRV
jgi:hypothetical protein